VVLSDSFDDEFALPDQPTGGDAEASSSRDLEEEGRLARLEAERRMCQPVTRGRGFPRQEAGWRILCAPTTILSPPRQERVGGARRLVSIPAQSLILDIPFS
jgi:hypothetical protein